MEIAAFLTDGRVVGFMLLFIRISALLVFLPFFQSSSISTTIKGAFAFYLSIMFYPLAPAVEFPLTVSNVLLAALTEASFGFAVGTLLSIVFAMIQYAGEQISFVMGFSMATAFDPQSNIQSPLISQFLNLLAIMVFLAFDGHHLLLLFMSHSLIGLPLGGFVFTQHYLDYAMTAMASLFVVGFTLAFPFLALSILSDIIFGMIMKTMPSFNLLVVGFPLKIFVAFVVMLTVLASMMVVFTKQFKEMYNALEGFL